MKKLAILLTVILSVIMCAPALATELPIVDEPVTLKVWAGGASTVTDMATNKMTLWYEKQTGVQIEWTHVPSEVETKLNLSLASGEYPDIYFCGFTSAQTMLNASAGIFLPLNDLIENESTYYKAILEADPAMKQNLTAPDGNIYTFYRTDAGVHMMCQNKMFVYQPWLDQYTEATGKGMPATTDEFEEMLIFFRDNDMNGNGDVADEVPLMGSYSAWAGDPIGFLMNPFQLWSGNFMVAEDNTVHYIANTDGFREGLKYINKLYEQGLIAEETYVQDVTQMKTRVNKSNPEEVTIGVFPTAHVAQYVDIAVMKTGLIDYAPIPPLEGPSGLRQAELTADKQIGLYGAITTTCKHPEIAMKWVDYMLGGEGLEVLFYGFEGTVEEGGQFIWSDEPAITGAVPSRSLTFNHGDPNNDWWGPYGLGPITDSTELRYSETNVYGHYGWAHYRGHEAYAPYYKNIGLPLVAWVTSEDIAAEISELAILLNDYVKNSATQFVLGVTDIDDDGAWEDYKNELNKMGLERYIELNQAYYFGE